MGDMKYINLVGTEWLKTVANANKPAPIANPSFGNCQLLPNVVSKWDLIHGSID
jgi:hypothetical protein